MGEKNEAILSYLEDNARFADLMNGAVFGGVQAVDPGQLEDASEHYTEKEGKGRNIKYRGRTRDIIRRVRNGGSILRLVALEAQETVDYGAFRTSLRELLAVLPLRKDRREMRKFIGEREAYRKLDRETLEAIAVMTDNRRLLEKAEDYRNEKGEYDMYEEMGSFFMDGVEEGMEKGIRAMILDNLENGSSREQIREKLGKYFGMSEKRASEYLEHFLQEKGCMSAI